MKSVPPRGSGWVATRALKPRVGIDLTAKCNLGVGHELDAGASAHPLPRGGTDLTPPSDGK